MERFHPSITSADYLQQANESTLVCVQIETKEALEEVENIAAVDGVDVLFVGPFDLGNNIGRPILSGVMHEDCKYLLSYIYIPEIPFLYESLLRENVSDYRYI